MKAIENTNLLIDMVEDFTLDKRNKYPKLYPNSDEVFKNKINKGFIKRNLHKLPEEEKKKYLDRIKYEYETYKKCDSIDMMLLQEDIINFCHKNNIWQGYSRVV